MPALLKIADGAVIRAGFNTTWECLSAGTPFLPLIGTTYVEPVTARIDRLTSLGLIPPDVQRFWFDDGWRAAYRGAAARIVVSHPGTVDPAQVGRLIVGRRPVRSVAIRRPRPGLPNGAKPRMPLVIRVDDVVCREPALRWLLDLLASRSMRASLEVVPYLTQIDDAFLDRFDPSVALFEVSQHGYAHVPRTSDSGRRCEFSPETDAPAARECEEIARGKTQLEKVFPKRFAGGFSPPYDVLPPWLPSMWQSLGGAFISCLHANAVAGSPVPVTRAGVDVWDWIAERSRGRDEVTRKLAVQLALDGHAGIVLHPRCLRDRSSKQHLLDLLKCVEEEGAETVSLMAVALGRIETATPASRLGPLRKSFGAKRLPGPPGCNGK